MPKINVYLPSDLAAAVRAAGFPVSPICQRALADAVGAAARARAIIESLRDPGIGASRFPEVGRAAQGTMTRRLVGIVELALAGRGPGELAGTGELLLGLLDEDANLCVRILHAFDVDLDELRYTLDRVRASQPRPDEPAAAGYQTSGDGHEPSSAGHEPAAGHQTSGAEREPSSAGRETSGAASWLSGLTMPARNAIAAAIEAAIGLGHNYVGSEHLLLGLLEDPETVAGRALGEHHVQAAEARRALPAALAGFSYGRQAGGQAPQDAHDELSRRLDALEDRIAALSG